MTGIHSAFTFIAVLTQSFSTRQQHDGALYNNHTTLLKTVHIYSSSPSLLYQLKAHNQTATHGTLYNNDQHSVKDRLAHIQLFTFPTQSLKPDSKYMAPCNNIITAPS